MESRLRDDGAELLGAARNLEPLVRSLSDGFDRDRQLPNDLVEAIGSANLFSMWFPHALGGPELPPIPFLQVIEKLSRQVEGDQLRATQGTGKADEKQRAVARPGKVGPARAAQPLDLRCGQRCRSTSRRPRASEQSRGGSHGSPGASCRVEIRRPRRHVRSQRHASAALAPRSLHRPPPGRPPTTSGVAGIGLKPCFSHQAL